MSTQSTSAPAKAASSSTTIRANAQAATQATSGGQGKCDFCDRVGLPILPLRYAAVPSYVRGATADPVGWAKLGIDLRARHPEKLQGHRYVLRTLRKGYVMVYLGSGIWHAYVVSAGGHLRKLADVDDPDHKNDREMSVACKRAGHNIPASFINIPPLPKGKVRMLPTKVWIAFSDVLWTKEIRQKYERRANGAAEERSTRFQAYVTDSLGKQADTMADAFQLLPDEAQTSSRLNALVVEYAADAAQAKLRTQYDATDPYDTKKTNRMTWEGAHGVAMRTGEATAVAKHATKLTPSNREQLMASAVVLDDPMGMVLDLNASRLGVVESRQRYFSDARVSRPLLVSQSIMGLKELIGEQAMATVAEREKGKPDVQTETVYSIDGLPIYSETTTRKERAEQKATSMWSSLQKHYREKDRLAFEKAVAATVDNFQSWLVKFDSDYAQWLDDPQWVRRSRDFDLRVPEQQDGYHEIMAAALEGGPTSSPVSSGSTNGAPQDARVYEVWKKFFGLPPTDEDNPIFTALFGNDQSLLEFLAPEGADPLDDKINKGSKLYKVIKTIIGTRELTSDTATGLRQNGLNGVMTREAANKVPNPVRVAGAGALNTARTRLTGASSAVGKTVMSIGGAMNRMGAGALTKSAEATVMRAIQGAVLLYERREIYLVTAKVRLRDYVAYLNDVAFKTADAAISTGTDAARHVTKAGKTTVRSMAVAGALRISDKKVADTFIEVVQWVYGELDEVSEALDAVPSERQISRAAHDAAAARWAAESAAMAGAMKVHPFTLSPKASEFVDAVVRKMSARSLAATTALKTMSTTSLRLLSTGSGILAAGSFVVQGWALKDSIKKADATLVGSNEARLLVAAGSVALVGATLEVAGVTGKLLGRSWAGKVGRLGGIVGAAASVVEGVQAFLSGQRAAAKGDADAKWLYRAAGVSLALGGVVGAYGALTGAALLGPIGWALILIAAGTVLLYFAMSAEDTQAGIWLDRCYWGKGSRFKNSGAVAERPWADREIDQELSQLNAIIIGLAGETGFNDDGWHFSDLIWDTVKAKLTFPGFSNSDSAFEWRLMAVNQSRALRVTLASGKHQTVPDDPSAIIVRAAPSKRAPVDTSEYFRNVVGPSYRREGKNNDLLVVEVSVEVRTKYFADIELSAEYVTDLADPRGRASLLLNESD